MRTIDGFEVDFLARSPEGNEALIQVCLDLAETGVMEREVRGLLSAAQEYPRAALEIVTLFPEAARNIPENIQVHDAAIWLLNPLAPWTEENK